MCTSGVMYLEEDQEEEIAEEVKDRVCEYSGLLSVREYELINEED